MKKTTNILYFLLHGLHLLRGNIASIAFILFVAITYFIISPSLSPETEPLSFATKVSHALCLPFMALFVGTIAKHFSALWKWKKTIKSFFSTNTKKKDRGLFLSRLALLSIASIFFSVLLCVHFKLSGFHENELCCYWVGFSGIVILMTSIFCEEEIYDKIHTTKELNKLQKLFKVPDYE